MPATLPRANPCRRRLPDKPRAGTASARVTFAPAFRHRRQDRHVTPGARGRFRSNPIEESQLGVEADIEARGDFERRILEDVRTASATPCHHGLVTHPQQRRDLWAEESKRSTNPPV
jgi:hypothetical protein